MQSNGRIWLVDDYPAFLKLTVSLLEDFGWEVVPFESGRALLDAYSPTPPECLLLDVRLPDITWDELLRGIRQVDAHAPVVLITGAPELEIAIAALKEGVHDYLVKPIEPQRLREVVQGALDQSEARMGVESHVREARRKLQRLTPREREVLDLLVQGAASKVIAARLDCSKKTVDVHRSAILRKFDVDNVVEVVRVFLQATADSRTDLPTGRAKTS